MKLVDVARHVIETEPAEGESIVHKLDETVAFYRTRDIFRVVLVEMSEDTTDFLYLGMREDGSPQDGYHGRMDNESLKSTGRDIDRNKLPALTEYILKHCCERLPDDLNI